MKVEDIFRNNIKWVSKKLSIDQEYFKNLSKGQSPDFLYIGCSDSRVQAEEIMGLEPGDVFVHRNIANMVTSDDLNAMSVLTYAVDHLKVSHIIVCGHYGCGGVKAAMGHEDLGPLNPWISKIKDVLKKHKAELDQISDEEEQYKKLVELNVKEQCLNLKETDIVAKALNEQRIKIHGWIFDIETGKLIDLSLGDIFMPPIREN